MIAQAMKSGAGNLTTLPGRLLVNSRLLASRQELPGVMPQRGIVAEIGVLRGDFSRHILDNNNPGKLFLIDIWSDDNNFDYVSTRYNNEIDSGRVELRRGYSTEVLNEFPDSYFDWVYIDTDHSYSTTLEELKICSRKVKDEGFICGHDYTTGNWYRLIRYGVIEAVNEFCINRNWELVFLTNEPDQCYSFALRKMASSV